MKIYKYANFQKKNIKTLTPMEFWKKSLVYKIIITLPPQHYKKIFSIPKGPALYFFVNQCDQKVCSPYLASKKSACGPRGLDKDFLKNLRWCQVRW